MARETIRFGLIGGGLMGKEFASAAARWMHLQEVNFQPVVTAACARHQSTLDWFTDHVPTVKYTTTEYKKILEDDSVNAVYCAVPHNLHTQFYTDIIRTGKHLLGEKPFGMDLEANRQITAAIKEHPEVFVRCVSQFSYYPGAYQIFRWLQDNRFGRIIEAEAGFLHCSDLNPDKPINWKRQVDINGEYGCMGDLGPHILHIPHRFNWRPRKLSAVLSNIMTERPDAEGRMVPCETWDNALLSTEVGDKAGAFPMTLHIKRIAPGHRNTWYLKVYGTEFSAEYSTKNPAVIRYLPFEPGGGQAWREEDVPHASAYPTNSGSIFEFGMSDAFLQMLAAYCDELVNGPDMRQPFYCLTPEEAARTHLLFTAALQSQSLGQTIHPDWPETAES